MEYNKETYMSILIYHGVILKICIEHIIPYLFRPYNFVFKDLCFSGSELQWKITLKIRFGMFDKIPRRCNFPTLVGYNNN